MAAVRTAASASYSPIDSSGHRRPPRAAERDRITSPYEPLFVTGIVDLQAPRPFDVVPDRTAKAIHDWISARHDDWRDAIAVAALDPFRGSRLRGRLPRLIA